MSLLSRPLVLLRALLFESSSRRSPRVTRRRSLGLRYHLNRTVLIMRNRSVHKKKFNPGSMALVPAPEKVRVGALILGRGSVYQYPTSNYMNRQRQPWSITGGLLRDCLPCLHGKYFHEPMLEAHSGSHIQLKNYVEDIEQVIYENRYLDNFGRGICWRLISSGIVCFVLLSGVMFFSMIKVLMADDVSGTNKTAMTIMESIFAVAIVTIRVLQTLVLYWKERELRHSMEVTSWDDGTITRGRPLTLFVLMWIYASLQVIVTSTIIFGNVFCFLHDRLEWTLLTTVLPVFVVSENFSGILQRKLEVWHGVIKEDQCKLALLETTKILQEMWSKMPDFDTQNKIYAFKEAITRSFNLEALKLSYMLEK